MQEIAATANPLYSSKVDVTPYKSATTYNNFYEFGTDKTDRLQMVDASGRLFNGDELLYVLAKDRLERGFGRIGSGKFDLGSIGLNILVERQRKSGQNKADAIRGFVPMVKDLLPLYDYAKLFGKKQDAAVVPDAHKEVEPAFSSITTSPTIPTGSPSSMR